MEDATQNLITVQTTVNAPVAKVWDYFTGPEHITKWCQASDDWHAPYAENDLKVGGKFKTTMAAKDGSFSFDFGGVYTEVKPNSLIEYKMDDSRAVSVTFIEEDDTTKVIETFDPETIN